MALKIRLQRKGTRHAPVYRMVVAESTYARDGRFVEILGTYAPQARGQDTEMNFKLDRIDYWMSVGALPSDTAKDLIRKFRKAGDAKVEPETEKKVEAEAEVVAEATETPAETPAES